MNFCTGCGCYFVGSHACRLTTGPRMTSTLTSTTHLLPLTAEQVRLIVREEIARALGFRDAAKPIAKV